MVIPIWKNARWALSWSSVFSIGLHKHTNTITQTYLGCWTQKTFFRSTLVFPNLFLLRLRFLRWLSIGSMQHDEEALRNFCRIHCNFPKAGRRHKVAPSHWRSRWATPRHKENYESSIRVAELNHGAEGRGRLAEGRLTSKERRKSRIFWDIAEM